jgi:hypothetical protein|tara:strand:- start:116 stop:1396 length:1281 start_codon:yes stop_codon:yes gene_type:complete
LSFNGDLNAADAGEDLTTKGDLHGFDTENTRIPVGADGTVLTADSTAALGLAYSTSAANVLTTQGDVLYHNASGLARLGAGVSGQKLQTQGAGANPIWASAAAATVDPNIVDMVYSITIGDYSQPTTAVASSEGTSDGFYDLTDFTPTFSTSPVWADQENFSDHATTNTTLGTNQQNRSGEIIADFGSSAIREVHSQMSMSPYSTAYVFVGNVYLYTSPDNITYTQRATKYINNSGGGSTDSSFKYDGGDSWRYCKVSGSTNSYYYVRCQGLFKNSSPTSTVTMYATNAVDDNTSTFWKSTEEANPWIYVDNGSTTNFNALALYPNAISTETEIKIQLSASTAFAGEEVTARTITYSDLTNGAWNFVRFNNNAGMRYARVYGSSGASSILGFNELKTLNFSDAEVGGEHGHLSISGTDTSLALDGT